MIPASILLAAMSVAADAPPADDEVLQIAPADLAKLWKRESTNVTDGIEPNEIARDAAGCAAVAFIIEKDGSTSSFRLLRDMPPERFAGVARKVVKNLRFAPTERNASRQPVFTFITITFRGPDVGATGSHSSSLVTVDDKMDTLCAVKDVK